MEISINYSINELLTTKTRANALAVLINGDDFANHTKEKKE